MKSLGIVARFWLTLVLAACLTVVPLAGATPAAAKTFTVNDFGDDPDSDRGDGVCSTGSVPRKCTLRAATNEANGLPGADVIVVPAGKYDLLAGCLLLRDEVSIEGAGQGKTIVDGTGNDAVFDIDAPGKNVTIMNMTIFRGVSSALQGGGVNNEASYRTDLISLEIIGNAAEMGGGVFNAAGASMRIESCVIRDNLAAPPAGGAYGGGVANFGKLTIVSTTISHNHVFAQGADEASGGGIHSGGPGRLTVVRSTIAGNLALSPAGSAYGGGISADGLATLEVTDTGIKNNQAKSAAADAGVEVHGGGIYSRDVATGTVQGTDIAGNSVFSLLTPAASRGGGIAVVSLAAPTVVTLQGQSSLTGNRSNSTGTGAYYRQDATSLVLDADTKVLGNLPK